MYSNKQVWIGSASASGSNYIQINSNIVAITGALTAANISATTLTASGQTTLSNLTVTGNVTGFNGVSSNQSFSNVYSSNIGIGTNTPAYPLDVVGNAKFSGNISAGNLGMFRNRIINGSMSINQRGITSATLPTNSFLFTADRFENMTYGSGVASYTNITLANTDTPYQFGFRASSKVSITTAYAASSLNQQCQGQRIERNNMYDFNWGQSFGQSITISFWSRTNGITNLPVTIRNPTLTYSYNANIAVTSSGTWQYNTITVPAPPVGSIWGTADTSLGMTLHIGGIQYYTDGFASTQGWSNKNQIGMTTSTPWITTVGNYVEFTGLQLEKGTIATPFEFRPYQIELQLCQRYFYKLANMSSSEAAMAIGFAVSTTNFRFLIQLPVYMRIQPNVGLSVFKYNPRVPITNNVTGQADLSIWNSGNGKLPLYMTYADLYIGNTNTPQFEFGGLSDLVQGTSYLVMLMRGGHMLAFSAELVDDENASLPII
jgi:hypothetical protein